MGCNTSKVDYDNCSIFIPPLEICHCISVYDGDTITVAKHFSINGTSKTYKYNVRIAGIDTPEIKTKNLIEKKYALMAKKYVENAILGKTIHLENISYDKYGRILANVYYYCKTKQNIADELLQNNLAKPYFGGKKIETNWDIYYNDC